MKRPALLIAIGSALCIVGLAAWHWPDGQPAALADVTPAPVPVVTTTVSVSDMPIVKVGLGTVSAYNTVDVRAQVSGTIEKIGFVEGQSVLPGSLIALIDPRPFQAALQQAQAALDRDQAHLANAQANLDRDVPLLKQGYSTEQQVGDQAAAVAQLRADLASDNAAIFNAQTQLGYTTIVSPIDGVTGIRRVDIGNIVQPGNGTPIVTISQLQPISVVFTLPQKDLPDVQAAMQNGSLPAIAYPQDGGKPLDKGVLLLVNNQINPTSGTIELKATFPNEKKTLWPGEFVEVRLVTSVRPGALSVPLTALQQGQAGESVFVVGADDTVQLRPVVVAETLDGRALIRQGLRAGEVVVAAGQYRLQNGVKIVAVPPGSSVVQNQTPATQGMLQ
jgi:multidrug efflux system membrane fusion protein